MYRAKCDWRLLRKWNDKYATVAQVKEKEVRVYMIVLEMQETKNGNGKWARRAPSFWLWLWYETEGPHRRSGNQCLNHLSHRPLWRPSPPQKKQKPSSSLSCSLKEEEDPPVSFFLLKRHNDLYFRRLDYEAPFPWSLFHFSEFAPPFPSVWVSLYL